MLFPIPIVVDGLGTMMMKGCWCACGQLKYWFVTLWLFLGHCRITFVIAEVFLLAGASENRIETKGQIDDGATDAYCRQVRKAVFAIGAAFSFLTMFFSLLYYGLLARSQTTEPNWQSYNSGAPTVGMTAYNWAFLSFPILPHSSIEDWRTTEDSTWTCSILLTTSICGWLHLHDSCGGFFCTKGVVLLSLLASKARIDTLLSGVFKF